MISMSRGKQTLAALAIATLAFTGLGATAQTHAARAQQSVYTILTGTWLGAALGDTGECGTEYGQFTFFRNGEYAYTENSDYTYSSPDDSSGYSCGGITNAGYYRVYNGVLTLHWVKCNYPCSPGTAAARFEFVGSYNAFDLSDAGGTYEYYRQ